MKKNTDLEQELIKIKQRNSKVEADKAWETSGFKKLLIFVLTYFTLVVFFIVVKFPRPFINAIVPSIAFILSTLSLPVFKKIWIKYFYKR